MTITEILCLVDRKGIPASTGRRFCEVSEIRHRHGWPWPSSGSATLKDTFSVRFYTSTPCLRETGHSYNCDIFETSKGGK